VKRPSRYRCMNCKATMNMIGAIIHLLTCSTWGHAAYELEP